MTGQHREQAPLRPSRPMAVVMVVILAMSAANDQSFFGSSARRHEEPEYASWQLPEISQADPAEWLSRETGLDFKPIDPFRARLVSYDRPGQRTFAIGLTNPAQSMVAQIAPAVDDQQDWPPAMDQFGDTVFLSDIEQHAQSDIQLGDIQLGDIQLSDGPIQDPRMLTEKVDYGHARVTWMTPRKSAAWPARMHLGRCVIGDTTLRITVHQLRAESPQPDYHSPPFRDLVRSLQLPDSQ